MGRVQLKTVGMIFIPTTMLFYAKKGVKKHHQFNDSYYIHIHASSCKVVGQMEFEMYLASLAVWRKRSSVLWLSKLLNFHLEQQRPSHNWNHAALAGVTGGPHWWQVIWGRTHSSVSLTSSSCLVGCCLQSCPDPQDESPRSSTGLTSKWRIQRILSAQPQWVFEHSSQRAMQNQWLVTRVQVQVRCKEPLEHHALAPMWPHSILPCTCSPHGCTGYHTS